ncbi:hypothetical protein IFM89_010080 [Coptis chinensis]|uniref:Uncharacterized protein n=1 Tax=Coptis chinensis TaxID=261450 RepID=A0A835HYR3_9MAGN|nr:hypothetical protein IFM89_010080 [Coptis chinensis]
MQRYAGSFPLYQFGYMLQIVVGSAAHALDLDLIDRAKELMNAARGRGKLMVGLDSSEEDTNEDTNTSEEDRAKASLEKIPTPPPQKWAENNFLMGKTGLMSSDTWLLT